jgi:hypothetical protein
LSATVLSELVGADPMPHPEAIKTAEEGCACASQAPFHKAVVILPCCVFPRLFAHRRLLLGQEGSDGGCASTDVCEVRTYPELVQYCLQQMGPTAQLACLPFEGANQAVYVM